MRTYQIYPIEDELAHHYYGRESYFSICFWNIFKLKEAD